MTDERTIAYLLNELPEHEAEQFEEQCFSQEKWPEEIESAEYDLIEAYLKDELSPERRRRFEENYLTTVARKEKVELARYYPHLLCQQKPTWTRRALDFLKSLAFSPKAAVPRYATILVTFGVAATVLLFALRTTPPQTFAHISLEILYDNRAAGISTQKLKLPLAEDALRISLALPESAPQRATYRVQWENKKGRIQDLAVENPNSNPISVIIPADQLTPGQYALKLFRKNADGPEERVHGNYFFNVE